MPRAKKLCSCTRCPAHEGYGCPMTVQAGHSKCPPCTSAADRARGIAAQRGYGHIHREGFRAAVLRRDHGLCTCTDPGHGHGPRCLLPATVADHHPLTRKQLVDKGLDPNDPTRGRSLCKGCHDMHTAAATPGGWNART